jgi:ketosteroid isomerase-like protein
MRLLFLSCFCILFFSCSDKKERGPEASATGAAKIELMETDKAFSNLSVQKGMKAAFIEYIDSNGVLLRPGHMPIVGASAIDFLIEMNDSSYTLEWKPDHAYVSKSADLGYTYGLYALTPSAKDTVIYGTYVSIWRKQADGKWKFVLDSGNEGVGEIK